MSKDFNFDCTFLPEALVEFVVVSDTHYMLDQEGEPVRFESRRQQSERARVALRQIGALKTDFVIHLGDLVGEYPDTPTFYKAMLEARTQLEASGIQLKTIPGNHDLGDKADPTMPTSPVTEKLLSWYHQEIGPSWFSFDQKNCHFVCLNSQIMNTNLPQADQQHKWVEQDLKNNSGKRIFLFMHLPPYISTPEEAFRGNYDNLDEPARSWLLDLTDRYSVEILFAAHVHMGVLDYYRKTRYFVARSTSFTRPGFSYMYTVGPLEERGRNDTGKLGFYLVRIREEHTDIHFLRTEGAITVPETADRQSKLVTCTPATFSKARVGVTLREMLTPTAEIPLSWPNSIRQKLRNDYPLLACLEMGIKSIRTQWDDLEDTLQTQRLTLIRNEGVDITPTSIWSEKFNLLEQIQKHASQIDVWEIQSPGSTWPPQDCVTAIRKCNEESSLPLRLSAVIPGVKSAGKHFPRTRFGFLIQEIEQIDKHLVQENLQIQRLHCLLSESDSWKDLLKVHQMGPFQQVEAIDFSLSFSDDDLKNANCTAEALLALTLLPNSILYFDPLVDLDRSKDVNHGLIDRVCNPRPAFHVVKCMNTILFSPKIDYTVFKPWQEEQDGISIRTLQKSKEFFSLLLPNTEKTCCTENVLEKALHGLEGNSPIRLYRLTEEIVTTTNPQQLIQDLSNQNISGPILITNFL